MSKPTIAVIAAGNMGAAVGARLAEGGATVLTSLKGRSPASVKRAKDAGMRDASDAEIAGADFVLSIVPPGEALGLAETLKPVLRAANRKPVYVECNAVSPQTVSEIAAVIAETDCPFVDGGIIGPPPRIDSSKTRIYVSGPDAARVGELNKYGVVIRVLDGTVGHASALKMSYGALNKGVVALGAAMALAAQRAGVGDAYLAELAESQSDLLGKLSRAVPDMLPKAYRWVAEFEEVAQFTGAGLEAEIFNGIAKLFDRIAADFDGAKTETGALDTFYRQPAKPAK